MQDNFHVVAIKGQLARLAWRRGDIDRALELIEYETRPVHRAEIYAAGINFEKAQEEVENLKVRMENTETWNQKRASREHFYAEGLIDMAKQSNDSLRLKQ